MWHGLCSVVPEGVRSRPLETRRHSVERSMLDMGHIIWRGRFFQGLVHLEDRLVGSRSTYAHVGSGPHVWCDERTVTVTIASRESHVVVFPCTECTDFMYRGDGLDVTSR